MKDYTKEQLQEGRPDTTAVEGIDFCLERLYEDKKHIVLQEFVKGLCFEELIGALLLAKDRIYELEVEVEEYEDRVNHLEDELEEANE